MTQQKRQHHPSLHDYFRQIFSVPRNPYVKGAIADSEEFVIAFERGFPVRQDFLRHAGQNGKKAGKGKRL